MIRYYLFIGLISIASVLFISSCQRDSISAEPQRFRLSQIKTSSFFVKGDSAFLQYESSGKLTSYTTVIAGAISLGVLSYNEKGQLTRSEEKPAPSIASYSNYKTYSYDQAGNATTIEFYATPYNSQAYSLRHIDKMEYNDRAQPVKTTTTTYADGKLLSTNIVESTYLDGNVVSLKVTEPINLRTTTTTFQFDDKPSPFYGLVGLSTGFAGPTYNRNNSTARRGGEEKDVTHQLTYDTNGLLTGAIFNANLTSNRQIKYTYKYETY